MLRGSVVIANDLLGIVVGKNGPTVTLKSKDGKTHTVKETVCTEVVNPCAYSAQLLLKLRSRVKR